MKKAVIAVIFISSFFICCNIFFTDNEPESYPTPTGTPPTASPYTSPPVERLLNGNFESGNVNWVRYLGSYDIIDGTSGNYHSGIMSAWFGGVVDYDDGMYQEVIIPADATQATLTYWIMGETEEVSGAWDWFEVYVCDTSLTPLALLAEYSNDDISGTWVQQAFDLSAYIGQTVRIALQSINDLSNFTNFFIDDVSLMANGS